MTTFTHTNIRILTPATVTKLTDIPSADFLNGMTTLDDTHILVADIYNGWVYKICTTTGAYSIILNDPKMKYPLTGASTNLGINGLKISDSHLYWTNTAIGILNRIQIRSDGSAIGESEVYTDNVPKADDFVFKGDGSIWVAQNQMDELGVVGVGETSARVVAGSNVWTVLAGVTAGHFGRGVGDKEVLYLATSGGEFFFGRGGRMFEDIFGGERGKGRREVEENVPFEKHFLAGEKEKEKEKEKKKKYRIEKGNENEHKKA
ncbi:hypothetical protein SBOR_4405 [Sclerotinia borealis F-4128]|uniref:SMP-30/Gluconolactonase/LRE-like region domain-containing protein n=1 Tax=Sclerotinia borealis (strain F-4128) TaxID=1432307 RepID=W9CH56_SCLBF|nr:hypothetical protein SBOR_4405 [Sclerotinia borealis F-4128]